MCGGDVLSTIDGHRLTAGTQGIDLSVGFAWSLWVNVASSNTSDTGADSIIGTRATSGGAWHKMDLAGISNWNGGGITYTSLADDTWHHIVYTGDSTGLQMFIDGTSVGTDLTVPTSTFDGKMEIGGTSQFSEDVTGLYDDIAIYNVRLTPTQVTALAGGASPASVIPEPSTFSLLGLALTGLCFSRRRK